MFVCRNVLGLCLNLHSMLRSFIMSSASLGPMEKNSVATVGVFLFIFACV